MTLFDTLLVAAILVVYLSLGIIFFVGLLWSLVDIVMLRTPEDRWFAVVRAILCAFILIFLTALLFVEY